MRNLLYALPFFAVIALAQDPPAKLMQGADNPPQDPAAKARVRTEGSAGGTGQPLTDEAKKGVGAGAGPHRTRPEAQFKRRVDPEEGSERREQPDRGGK